MSKAGPRILRPWRVLLAFAFLLTLLCTIQGQVLAHDDGQATLKGTNWTWKQAGATPGSTARVSISFMDSTFHMETETQIYRNPKAPVAVGNPLAQALGSYAVRGDKVFLNFDTGDTLRGSMVADPRRTGKRAIMLDVGPLRIGIDEQ